MEDTLTSFKIAKLAKQKGFDIAVVNFFANKKIPYAKTAFAYQSEKDDISNWNNGKGSYPTNPEDVLCSAPTLSLLQKWLREAKGVDIVPPLYFSDKGYACVVISQKRQKFHESYDEALESKLQEKLKELPDYIYEK